MDENTNPDSLKPKTEPKSQKQKKWLMWLLVLLVLLLLGAAGYLWWQLKACQDKETQLKKDKQQLQQQIDELNKNASSSPAEEMACNDTPSDSMKENIKAALDSKNTAAFSTYTTNPVKYVLAASELGGDFTPDQAATNLEYTHSATSPWDFNLPPATVSDYDSGFYTDYFDSNTYVGKAASGMVVSFDFDCNGKIKQIFVAADEDLL
jgi:cytoskeletal protein RodZ